MALTISNIINDGTKEKRIVYATIGFDSSYADGGEPLVPGDVGMSAFHLLSLIKTVGTPLSMISPTRS